MPLQLVLPQYAHIQQILLVLAKLNAMTITSPEVAHDTRWHMEAPETSASPRAAEQFVKEGGVDLYFRDPLGHPESWYMALDDEWDNGRRLFADEDSSLALVTARQVLRFFGGQLFYDDEISLESDEEVSPDAALLPPPSREPRYRAFHAAMAKLSPITSAQWWEAQHEALPFDRTFSHDPIALTRIEHLRVRDEEALLRQELDETKTDPRPKPRL